MTFFLKDQGIDENTPGRVSPISQIPSYMDSAGANKVVTDLETNANRVQQQATARVRGNTAVDLMMDGLVSLEDFNAHIEETMGFDHIRKPSESVESASGEYGEDFTKWVIDTARERAAESPDAFSGYGLADEDFDATVNAELQTRYQNAMDIVNMTSDEYVGEGFAGGMGSALTDMRQAPFLLMGGGSGSILKLAGREAMINAGTELALMGSQFDMAERLDIADPNVAQQIGLAAAFGGIFGGATGALERGISAYRGRQQPPQGFDFG